MRMKGNPKQKMSCADLKLIHFNVCKNAFQISTILGNPNSLLCAGLDQDYYRVDQRRAGGREDHHPGH